MRNRITLAVLLVVLLLALAGWTVAQKARVQWEYETITKKTVAELDSEAGDINRVLEAYGRAGWELVTVENYSRGGEALTRLYFKRQK